MCDPYFGDARELAAPTDPPSSRLPPWNDARPCHGACGAKGGSSLKGNVDGIKAKEKRKGGEGLGRNMEVHEACTNGFYFWCFNGRLFMSRGFGL